MPRPRLSPKLGDKLKLDRLRSRSRHRQPLNKNNITGSSKNRRKDNKRSKLELQPRQLLRLLNSKDFKMRKLPLMLKPKNNRHPPNK